jgi:predicted HD phosphohydrolase
MPDNGGMTHTTSSPPAPLPSNPAARRIAGVDGLLELLDAARNECDGEPVDLLTHGLQCAAVLERTVPDDLELQVAGLVHDLGTVLVPGRPSEHSRAGATAVEPLLGARIAALVAGHDLAKRYLVTVDATYRDQLTPRSLATLRAQGGLLDPEERAAFLARPDADALVALRHADDAAKDPERTTAGLEHWTLALYAVAATADR